MSRTFLAALIVLPLCACCTQQPQAETNPPPLENAATVPSRISVTDLETFNAFIATRPTPDALREKYPGLAVVTPGTMATRELRGDNSRYFVDLDEQGRVSGGKFQ